MIYSLLSSVLYLAASVSASCDVHLGDSGGVWQTEHQGEWTFEADASDPCRGTATPTTEIMDMSGMMAPSPYEFTVNGASLQLLWNGYPIATGEFGLRDLVLTGEYVPTVDVYTDGFEHLQLTRCPDVSGIWRDAANQEAFIQTSPDSLCQANIESGGSSRSVHWRTGKLIDAIYMDHALFSESEDGTQTLAWQMMSGDWTRTVAPATDQQVLDQADKLKAAVPGAELDCWKVDGDALTCTHDGKVYRWSQSGDC